MATNLSIPSAATPWTDSNGYVAQSWYLYLQQFAQMFSSQNSLQDLSALEELYDATSGTDQFRAAAQPIQNIVAGTSPTAFTAPADCYVVAAPASGGTFTAVTVTRGASVLSPNFSSSAGGLFLLARADVLTITYTGTFQTFAFVPWR